MKGLFDLKLWHVRCYACKVCYDIPAERKIKPNDIVSPKILYSFFHAFKLMINSLAVKIFLVSLRFGFVFLCSYWSY